MDKEKLLIAIMQELEAEIDITSRAATAAHEAATHEELVAENKYDTKGLEASYLAGAQANRAMELKRELSLLASLKIRRFTEGEPIAFGAMVVVESEEGERKNLFLCPCQGGKNLETQGRSVFCITPDAPMGKAILGKQLGDSFEIKIKGKKVEFEIVEIY